jgi:hypothetical protein
MQDRHESRGSQECLCVRAQEHEPGTTLCLPCWGTHLLHPHKCIPFKSRISLGIRRTHEYNVPMHISPGNYNHKRSRFPSTKTLISAGLRGFGEGLGKAQATRKSVASSSNCLITGFNSFSSVLSGEHGGRRGKGVRRPSSCLACFV